MYKDQEMQFIFLKNVCLRPGISRLLILVLQQTWKELVFSHFADKETEVQGDYGTLWQVHSLLEAGLDFKSKSP